MSNPFLGLLISAAVFGAFQGCVTPIVGLPISLPQSATSSPGSLDRCLNDALISDVIPRKVSVSLDSFTLGNDTFKSLDSFGTSIELIVFASYRQSRSGHAPESQETWTTLPRSADYYPLKRGASKESESVANIKVPGQSKEVSKTVPPELQGFKIEAILFGKPLSLTEDQVTLNFEIVEFDGFAPSISERIRKILRPGSNDQSVIDGKIVETLVGPIVGWSQIAEAVSDLLSRLRWDDKVTQDPISVELERKRGYRPLTGKGTSVYGPVLTRAHDGDFPMDGQEASFCDAEKTRQKGDPKVVTHSFVLEPKVGFHVNLTVRVQL